ncbi:MATE family efflux transporter [Faecalicoccus pleomorphus]|uniref:MATE family efflux transporter n=1 Tax=Faecalicoccus pleomorphus TaxID=1323 RepID=UPI0026EFFF9B|nr:MATE family efflux transporter [Faecalicoccus pleomorphus]
MNPKIDHEQPVSKLYMQLAIPLVFSMVITLVYNLTDTFFVAATANTNLVAGVSLGAPVFTFLMALGNIFGQGGSSLMACLLGQNRIEDGRHVSVWCFYLSLMVGFVIGILLILFQKPMLSLLGANKETFDYAKEYYIWLAIGAPVIVNSFVHTNLLRTEGLAKESMISTIGGAIVNILLDPLLIPTMDLGAAGAAIATVIGYIFTMCYSLYVVQTKSDCLSASVHKFHISSQDQKQILSIGVAAAITNIMQSVGVIFLNLALLPYGNDKIAAMGIALKISLIVLMIITGLTFGGQPLFGFYYGANNKERLRKTILFATLITSAAALGLSLFVILLAPQLLSVFLSDASFIRIGTPMLQFQVISMVCVGLIMLATILFQSIGKAIPALILSICRQGVIFMIGLYILPRLMGSSGILLTQALADLLTALIALFLFYRHFHWILKTKDQ